MTVLLRIQKAKTGYTIVVTDFTIYVMCDEPLYTSPLPGAHH